MQERKRKRSGGLKVEREVLGGFRRVFQLSRRVQVVGMTIPRPRPELK